MDLGAYSQIEDLNHVMAENHIFVPRLRGLRLMSQCEPYSQEELKKLSDQIGLNECELSVEGYFRKDPVSYEVSSETRKRERYYLIYENGASSPSGIRWDRVHGYKRKLFKYNMRKAEERVKEQYAAWNKYAGRNDVLYIHARIGGGNWDAYDGPEIEKQEWFLEKVDDAFDGTYCDIYAKIQAPSDPA